VHKTAERFEGVESFSIGGGAGDRRTVVLAHSGAATYRALCSLPFHMIACSHWRTAYTCACAVPSSATPTLWPRRRPSQRRRHALHRHQASSPAAHGRPA
jgi:hypothetical protein